MPIEIRELVITTHVDKGKGSEDSFVFTGKTGDGYTATDDLWFSSKGYTTTDELMLPFKANGTADDQFFTPNEGYTATDDLW